MTDQTNCPSCGCPARSIAAKQCKAGNCPVASANQQRVVSQQEAALARAIKTIEALGDPQRTTVNLPAPFTFAQPAPSSQMQAPERWPDWADDRHRFYLQD